MLKVIFGLWITELFIFCGEHYTKPENIDARTDALGSFGTGNHRFARHQNLTLFFANRLQILQTFPSRDDIGIQT